MPKIKNSQQLESNHNANERDSSLISNLEENGNTVPKRFRFHKTQIGSDSSKSIGNQRC